MSKAWANDMCCTSLDCGFVYDYASITNLPCTALGLWTMDAEASSHPGLDFRGRSRSSLEACLT